MQEIITYQVNAAELKEIFLEPLRRELLAEQRAKYNEKIIDVETVAKIHGIHPDTVYNYLNSGDIECEPRVDNGKCRFKLGNALEFDFRGLRRKLRDHNFTK